MSNIKFVLNRKGVGEILKSAEMQEVLSGYAAGIKSRCGEGYEQDVRVGRNRASARVSAATPQAKAENMKNNTILKAVK